MGPLLKFAGRGSGPFAEQELSRFQCMKKKLRIHCVCEKLGSIKVIDLNWESCGHEASACYHWN